jgi:hypothetical protein
VLSTLKRALTTHVANSGSELCAPLIQKSYLAVCIITNILYHAKFIKKGRKNDPYSIQCDSQVYADSAFLVLTTSANIFPTISSIIALSMRFGFKYVIILCPYSNVNLLYSGSILRDTEEVIPKHSSCLLRRISPLTLSHHTPSRSIGQNSPSTYQILTKSSFLRYDDISMSCRDSCVLLRLSAADWLSM